MRPTPPSEDGNDRVGIDAKLLAFNVIAGEFAKAELRGIVAHALKTKFAAEFFEVEVVALGQRVGHVHAEAGKLDRSVARNKTLRKRGQCYGKLDGGAGFSSRREGQLLVDHRQNASVGGIDHDGGAVHVAQGVDRGLAN